LECNFYPLLVPNPAYIFIVLLQPFFKKAFFFWLSTFFSFFESLLSKEKDDGIDEETMKKLLIVLVVVFLIILTALADLPDKKHYTTRHINPHPPVIDGKLDDSVWQKVDWESSFIQREPYERKEPSQKTAFKILYDNKNLYIAVIAYDTDLDKIERRMSRRDNVDGDWVGIDLDSYFDHRTAFCFTVNAAGVKGDHVITNDGDNQDSNWDPIWYVKTAACDEGWTAEMKIPFSQLRFGNKESHTWGLQVTRSLFRKEERSNWQFIPKDSPGWVHRFGELRGISGIKAPRQVELLPYTVGRMQRFQREEGNPFATGRLNDFMGGLDGKIGLTSDLTLDFTINPDFGQVEADPSVVNLTAFETYYAEKRPFFIEGKSILSFQIMGGDGSFSSDNLFYSRRIGRRPHHTPDIQENEHLDMPDNTSIITAFKITGKTKHGLSIGILDSITAEEHARLNSQGQSQRETVEPLTNYFGLRLQKDYNKGNTIIGGMFTATSRNIKDQHLNYLHDAAYSGGFDFYHSWKDKTYYFSLKTVFSNVRGNPEAILRTQESPVRYFQRPDASHVTLDPNRTSLSGYGGTANFGKGGSGHFRFSSGVTWRSPGLELNDMGYLRSADKIMQWVWANYGIWDPFSIFRKINFNFNQWMGWDFSGEKISKGGNIGLYGQFKNYWGFSLGTSRQGEGLSSSALRGGPSLRYPGGWNTWCFFWSDNRKKIQFSLGTDIFIGDDKVSGGSGYEFGLTYRPTNALSISVVPSFNHSKDALQYVETRDFNQEKRYLFGTIDQRTLSVTLRLNLSLTPELSIQFYGQPFVSAGKYFDLRRITDSRAKKFEDRFHQFAGEEMRYDQDEDTFIVDENGDGIVDYSFGNPDFNFLQFRSNLVVRWEYIPGSALYLVWSQGRTGNQPAGEFSFRDGVRNLFGVYPHNVFLIKLSYCFQL